VVRALLIANRGEIAVRIARACREMGIRSVAVYSDADARALHVSQADAAVRIGPAAPSASYLSIDALIGAARSSGADAVHPGYGFLSENDAFARACEAAGLTWVGPPPDVIRRMGSKIAARQLMESAGVPVVPGSTPRDQSDAGILAAVRTSGFPALVKPSEGGGGKGMRVLRDERGALELIGASRREALGAFGDGTLYVERLIVRPRHVEIQVFGDASGHVVHLFERECSLQRRHQKIVEESPSTALTPALRARMGEAAVAAACAAGYRNAGTIEFLVEGHGDSARFYFLEMNTRLQVEHPVTEAVTGIDLVRTQLIVASGGELPWTQASLAQRGHAVECRVYAEDPASGFLPQAGTLLAYREPSGPGIRIDSGVAEGGTVGVHYDPLLAKLIAFGDTREEALERAVAALDGYRIAGIRTNIPFLGRLLRDDRVRRGEIHTQFVDEHLAELAEEPEPAERSESAETAEVAGSAADDPWVALRGWRLGSGLGSDLDLSATRKSRSDPRPAAPAGPGSDLDFLAHRKTSDPGSARESRSDPKAIEAIRKSRSDPKGRRPWTAGHHGSLMAPMPATVAKIEAQVGQQVKRGETLLILEAMKMELPVRAPADGAVTAINCAEGELVQPGVPLIEIDG
jgi:acetyl/propionyl-CoA carboxylase alpha subunit